MPCANIAVFVLFVFGLVYSLKVIPERGNVTYINHKFMDMATLVIRRYGRGGNYLINGEGRNKHTWANNVTTHMVFYEYLHNEYRRSFVEMHHRLCDLINEEPYVGRVLAKAGLVCPLPAGYYKISNMSFQMDFPSKWPYERARIQGTVTLASTNETLIQGYVDFRFIEENKTG